MGVQKGLADPESLSTDDQARSDADDVSSLRDQAHTEADERASRRDQTASDQDRSLHASTDAKFAEAFAAVESERERTVGDREAAAHDRDRAAEDRARAAEDREVAAVDRNRAALDREQARKELERARIELDNAQLDDLTGFYRVGLGTAVLQREIDRARRSNGRLTFAYCDVDGLKKVNDEEGHAAGDALLADAAKAIRNRLRSYDPVVRVGGDEFVCAISNIDLEQAADLFRDIQHDLSKTRDGSSVSFGLAALSPDDDLGGLMERSDLDLRKAKSTGRVTRV
jgi:diguanylate cyclase (GGDEF)-like protein